MMLPRTAAVFLMSTALLSGAALAQTTTAPTTTTPPVATTPATPAPAPAAANMSMSGKFMTDQGASEFRASKFVGLDIYGSNNEKIGDINDILIDPQGQAKAVVIGVGGFLGIGEKNVALPWGSVKWVMEKPAARTASTAPSSTGSTAPPVTAAPTTAGTPATTAPTRSPAEQAAYNGYPDHGMVTLTKADLQNAPAFKYYSESHTSTGETKK